jgi:hypothetical protein
VCLVFHYEERTQIQGVTAEQGHILLWYGNGRNSMSGSKLEPLINVCRGVTVNFRPQLQERTTGQDDHLGDEFFKNKKHPLNGILLLILVRFFLYSILFFKTATWKLSHSVATLRTTWCLFTGWSRSVTARSRSRMWQWIRRNDGIMTDSGKPKFLEKKKSVRLLLSLPQIAPRPSCYWTRRPSVAIQLLTLWVTAWP